MEAHPDLFAYPTTPGFKRVGTSEDAAHGIAPRARTLREQVLAEIRRCPATPELVAARLREPVHSIRPRFSELSALKLIEDTGARGTAMGGRRCIVWRAR